MIMTVVSLFKIAAEHSIYRCVGHAIRQGPESQEQMPEVTDARNPRRRSAGCLIDGGLKLSENVCCQLSSGAQMSPNAALRTVQRTSI